MKKNILFMFFGAIIATVITISVYALTANDIEYGNTTVKNALDTLYQRSNYAEYNGSTEVTPSTETQTLNTNNRLLRSNITINPIPNDYTHLNGEANISGDKILNGYSAFDNSGELVTGNLSTTCLSGTYNKPANSQWIIDLGFVPSKYTLFWNNGMGDLYATYNSAYSDINVTTIYDNAVSTYNYFSIVNNKIQSSFATTTSSYKKAYTIQYVACQ